MRGKVIAIILAILLISTMHINTVSAERNINDGISITSSTILNLSFYYNPQISISDLFYLLAPSKLSILSSVFSFLDYNYQYINGEAVIEACNNTDYKNYTFSFSLNSMKNSYNISINLTEKIGRGFVAQKMYVCSNYTSFGWNLLKFRFTFDQQPIFETIPFSSLNYNYTVPISINNEPLLYMGTDSFIPAFNPLSLAYLYYPNFNFFPDMLNEINDWNIENGTSLLTVPPIGSVGLPDHWINALFTNTITAYNYTYILSNFTVKILSYPSSPPYNISIYKGDILPAFYINEFSLLNSVKIPYKNMIFNKTQNSSVFSVSLNKNITDFTIFVSAGNLTDAFYFKVYDDPVIHAIDLIGKNSTIFIFENSSGDNIGFGSSSINNSKNINISGSFKTINIYGFKDPITKPDYEYPYFSYPIGPIFLNNTFIFDPNILYLYDFYEPYRTAGYMLVQSNQVVDDFRNMFDFYYCEGSKNYLELKTSAVGVIKIYDLFGNLINGSEYNIDLNTERIAIHDLETLEKNYEFLNIEKIRPFIIVQKNGTLINITVQNISNVQGVYINNYIDIQYVFDKKIVTRILSMNYSSAGYSVSFRLPEHVTELTINYSSSNIYTENASKVIIIGTGSQYESYSFMNYLFIVILLMLIVALIGGRKEWT